LAEGGGGRGKNVARGATIRYHLSGKGGGDIAARRSRESENK